MFTTYPEFKFPSPLPGSSGTTWMAVELALNAPVLVCTISDCDDKRLRRSFFLADEHMLFECTSNDDIPLQSLHVMLPPAYAISNDWEFVSIGSVHVADADTGTQRPRVVFKARNGTCYSGFPLEQTKERTDAMRTVATLPS